MRDPASLSRLEAQIVQQEAVVTAVTRALRMFCESPVWDNEADVPYLIDELAAMEASAEAEHLWLSWLRWRRDRTAQEVAA